MKRSWIIRRPEPKNRKPKTTCSVCKRNVYDNVDPQKIITCAYCVQGLLLMSRSEKIRLRDQLLEKGDAEGARAAESFIPPESNTLHATLKTSRSHIDHKHIKTTFKRTATVLSEAQRGNNEN